MQIAFNHLSNSIIGYDNLHIIEEKTEVQSGFFFLVLLFIFISHLLSVIFGIRTMIERILRLF